MCVFEGRGVRVSFLNVFLANLQVGTLATKVSKDFKTSQSTTKVKVLLYKEDVGPETDVSHLGFT